MLVSFLAITKAKLFSKSNYKFAWIIQLKDTLSGDQVKKHNGKTKTLIGSKMKVSKMKCPFWPH